MLFGGLLCFSAFGCAQGTSAQEPMESIYDIALEGIDGKPLDLSQYKGKKILFVNVASECGFTGQYDGLQELYENYNDKLVIIGLPCNQFGSQEPGSEQEIQSFCLANYGVEFPMASKVEVKGRNQHPLYQWLTKKLKTDPKILQSDGISKSTWWTSRVVWSISFIRLLSQTVVKLPVC